jgi:hypothetical protein
MVLVDIDRASQEEEIVNVFASQMTGKHGSIRRANKRIDILGWDGNREVSIERSRYDLFQLVIMTGNLIGVIKALDSIGGKLVDLNEATKRL